VKLGEKIQIATELQEIFATEGGAVYQCDKRNRLILNFAGSQITLKVDAFLRLKNAVDNIDLNSMAVNTNRDSDYELITVCGCDKIYVLTLLEVYSFKELLGGARFALELNSVLHECLHVQLA
jgi:hypothetical protein